ncbi:MAG: hypothetical protein ACYC3X_15790 [Pirellulaceae bacterium]
MPGAFRKQGSNSLLRSPQLMMPRLRVSFGPGEAEAPAANGLTPAQVDAAVTVAIPRNSRLEVDVPIECVPGKVKRKRLPNVAITLTKKRKWKNKEPQIDEQGTAEM